MEFDFEVVVLKRSGGTWLRETELMSFFRPPAYDPAVRGYADRVRLSADGSTLAVSDPTDSMLGTGVLQTPGPHGATRPAGHPPMRRRAPASSARSYRVC